MKNGLDVAIIDYGMGNLFSVLRACEHAGLNAGITSDGDEIAAARSIILPGVGAFGDAMANIKKLGLISVIKRLINAGRPFMGICLGMQLLMSRSEEFGSHKGLDIFKGSVIRFPEEGKSGKKIKVPHVGWGKILPPTTKKNSWESSMLAGVPTGDFMYFVHSYYAVPSDKDVILSVSDYGGVRYCSSIARRNVFATQFHPEKSAHHGLRIYNNWALAIKKRGSVN